RGRGKAQGNQRRLFHPAGFRAPAGGVKRRAISPVQGSHGNWSLAVHKSACDYRASPQFGGLCIVGHVMASTTTAARQNVSGMPDIKVSARQLFGIDTDMEVPAFSAATEHVPAEKAGT